MGIEIIEGFNIPVLTMDGYEADDNLYTYEEAERQIHYLHDDS
jgi:hypothetical protein